MAEWLRVILAAVGFIALGAQIGAWLERRGRGDR